MSAYFRYQTSAAAKDVQGVLAAMRDDVRLHSPTKLKPFEGKTMVGFLFAHLFEVLQDFSFTHTAVGEGRCVLFFRCQIAGREAEGCDILDFDADGQIADFSVMIRPLSALEALNREMGARLLAGPPLP
jgi:hypothetical protein